MSPSNYPFIPSSCTNRWLDERLAARLSEGRPKIGALCLWVQDAKDAWGNLYEIRSILGPAGSGATGFVDARRAVERVVTAEIRLKRIQNLRLIRQTRGNGTHPVHHHIRPRAKGLEHTHLCHLAALWGEYTGKRPDGAPIPNPSRVEVLLADLAKRYHYEIAALHRSRHGNAILYGEPRSVRIVGKTGRLVSDVKGGGVALKAVFRDRRSGKRYFRVEFKRAGGKRCFEADLPVDCDLDTVELPKPKPAPKCPSAAPQTTANLDFLSRLAFYRDPLGEDGPGHHQQFQKELPWWLLGAARCCGVRLGKGHDVKLGATICSEWSRHNADWDVQWGISLLDVDLIEGELHARFDTPTGQQFATIPLSEIMRGIRPTRKIVDGVVMMPPSRMCGRLYIARKPLASDESSPWMFGHSVQELREMGALGLNERYQVPSSQQPKDGASRSRAVPPASDSSFDRASVALQGSIFD